METMATASSATTMLELLKKTYEERRGRNASYSLSSFSRDLGIAKPVLSRALSGVRPITVQLAMQICVALDIPDEQSRRLLLNTVRTSSKNSKVSQKIRDQFEKEDQAITEGGGKLLAMTLELERFKAMGNWHHLAILNLTKIKGFKNDPEWVAKRLGISCEEAKEGLERLVLIGVLLEDGGHVRRSSQSLYMRTQRSEEAVRDFHEQMIVKGLGELKKTTDVDFNRRLISGITFPCDVVHVELIKEKINRFQDEILAIVAGEAREGVYQMNVQFFPLSDGGVE